MNEKVVGKVISSIIIIVFVLSIISTINSFLGNGVSNDYARAISVNYTAELTIEGHLNITEECEYEIVSPEDAPPYRELYRELFISNENVKNQIGYDSFSLSQIINGKKLPFIYIDYNTVSSVERELLNQREVGYFTFSPSKERSVSNGTYWEIRWFINEYNGNFDYVLEYRHTNVLTKYNDCADLYIMLEEGESVKYVKDYRATIILPNAVSFSNLSFSAKEQLENNNIANGVSAFSHRQPQTSISLENNKVLFDFKNPRHSIDMKTPAFVEFRLLFSDANAAIFSTRNNSDLDMRVHLVGEERNSLESLNKKLNTKVVNSIIDIALAISVFGVCYLIIKRLKKSTMKYTPEIAYEFFRDIPPVEPAVAARLIALRRAIRENALSGAIMGLINKGYLEITKLKKEQDWSERNIGFFVISKDFSNLYETERLAYMYFCDVSLQKNSYGTTKRGIELLSAREGADAVKGLLNFSNIKQYSQSNLVASRDFDKRFRTAIKNAITAEKYLEGSLLVARAKLSTFCVMAMTLGVVYCILGSIFMMTLYGFAFITTLAFIGAIALASSMLSRAPTLTQKGENEYARCNGLYNFFDKLSLVNEAEIAQVVRWEEYLVYATSFGLADKVLKTLQLRLPSSVNTDFEHFGGSYLTMSIISRSIQNGTGSFRHSSQSSGSGRGSSFGGGGGGGGGFGGGGHGGRR